MSRKQEIARTRNFTKMRIVGMIANLEQLKNTKTYSNDKIEVLYWYEMSAIDEAIDNLKNLVMFWDSNTKDRIKDFG